MKQRKQPAGGKPFQKGQSGNPGGRPRIPEDVKELARGYSVEAIETLATIMKDVGQSGSARVSAASTILDRGYGKAPQHITTERIETLSDEQLARELALAISGLRKLGIDPESFGLVAGDQAPGTAH
jgi:hypothetical protein